MQPELLRTRRQTRAAVLDRLLARGGLFRPQLALECQLTEASISRIVAELREDGLVEELRRPVPYQGGPSQLVVLRRDQWVAGLDLTNDRVSVGAATLDGEIGWQERFPLAVRSDPAAVTRCFEAALAALTAWCGRRGVVPRRIAASIPGLRDPIDAPNPIVALDAAWLSRRLGELFPEVPHGLAVSVAARASVHLRGPQSLPVEPRQLFIRVGHGVGGAWIEPVTTAVPIRPIELGHVVVDVEGPRCRCGHRGCLEAFASATAVARICGIAEDRLAVAGDDWPSLVSMTPRRAAALRSVLRQLGLVIGNVLNVMPAARIVLSGWPVALPPSMHGAVAEGMDRSLFGGLAANPLPVTMLPSALDGDPRPALSWAMHELVRDGGMPPAAREAPRLMTG